MVIDTPEVGLAVIVGCSILSALVAGLVGFVIGRLGRAEGEDERIERAYRRGLAEGRFRVVRGGKGAA